MNIIDKFLAYLETEMGYSRCTLASYGHDIRSWADYATAGRPETLDVASVTASDLRAWLGALAREGMAPRSLRRKQSSLRAFFRFLMREHSLPSNPCTDLAVPRTPTDLPVFVRPAEMSRALDEAAPEPGEGADFAATRAHLILLMLYSTGMRCSELIGLRDVDTDTRRRELKVMGKRSKERIIPMGEELALAIDRYRSRRDADPARAVSPADREAPLLVRDNGEPLYRKMVYNTVHSALASAGVHARRLSPHVLRHSFATDMLNAGAPLNSVRMLLGHQDLVSTQVYTHVTYSELQHNYQLAHPRALKKGGQHGH